MRKQPNPPFSSLFSGCIKVKVLVYFVFSRGDPSPHVAQPTPPHFSFWLYQTVFFTVTVAQTTGVVTCQKRIRPPLIRPIKPVKCFTSSQRGHFWPCFAHPLWCWSLDDDADHAGAVKKLKNTAVGAASNVNRKTVHAFIFCSVCGGRGDFESSCRAQQQQPATAHTNSAKA